MRIRTLAGAVVVAAGLSATLTGAAGAAPAHDDPPPEADVLVVTCEDGRATTRPLTEEERERIEDIRGRVERGEIDSEEGRRVLVEDGNVIVFRGEVPRDVERTRRVHALPPDAVPAHVIAVGGPGEPVACAVPALPTRTDR